MHPANIQDRDGAKLVLHPNSSGFPRLEQIGADGAYAGKLVRWAKLIGGWRQELVPRPAQQHTFQVLPRRWVVVLPRKDAWLGRQRRLSKDYEGLPETSEAWVYTAMTGLMLRRLAPSPTF